MTSSKLNTRFHYKRHKMKIKTKVTNCVRGVNSPLLSNIYLNLLDRIISNPRGKYYRAGIRMVRYAYDWVLMACRLTRRYIDKIEELLTRMGLSLNKEKSKKINAYEEPIEFLGFTMSFSKSKYGIEGYYWDIKPSRKSCKRIYGKIRTYLRIRSHLPINSIIPEVNSLLRGWINYYGIKGVSHMYRVLGKLRWMLDYRFYRFFRDKSQCGSRSFRQGAYVKLVSRYGLIDLTKIAIGLTPVHA